MKYVLAALWLIALLLSIGLVVGSFTQMGCAAGCSVISESSHGIPAVLSLINLIALPVAYFSGRPWAFRSLTALSFAVVVGAVLALIVMREWCPYCVALQTCYVGLFLASWFRRAMTTCLVGAAYCCLACFAAARAVGVDLGSYQFHARSGDPTSTSYVLFADPLCPHCHDLWAGLSQPARRLVTIRWRLLSETSEESERIAAICECVDAYSPRQGRLFTERVMSHSKFSDAELLKLAQETGVTSCVKDAIRTIPEWADAVVADDGMLAQSLSIRGVPAVFHIVGGRRQPKLAASSQSDILRDASSRGSTSEEQ